VRKEVLWFAEGMDDELTRHSPRKGERGWDEDSIIQLIVRAEKKLKSLKEAHLALAEKKEFLDGVDGRIITLTFDLGNYAMMLGDKARLRREQRRDSGPDRRG